MFIFDNLHLHSDVIHIANSEDKPLLSRGDFVIRAIKFLYSEAVALVRVGGYPEAWCETGQSSELLVCRRRRMHEITLPGMPHSLAVFTYAGDLSVFTCWNEDMYVVLEAFSMYATYSEASLNISKSVGFWTGFWKNRADGLFVGEW